jgi:chromosome segregation protein
MHLKFIEIFGFKTFPDKVRIPFHQGINVIVGPNGCGKTNIVDAVRFILGEQNLKDLRLKTMNDIIFHGSNIRNQSSVALCRGVFENETAGSFKYKDFSEVMVERRHFKNKETEYRINGISVPYREYLDFFNESGLSKHYSIIDSSKINALLNYKPNELRLFFEEASGITKYKIQKKSASKKLEATVNNMFRIGDLFNEVEKQLESLEKASKKLSEYKKLESERRRYEFALYGRMKNKITSDLDKFNKDLENYVAQLTSAEKESNFILNVLTGAKTSFDAIESEYRLSLNKKNEYLVKLAKLNSDIEYGNIKIKNIESEILKKGKDIEEQTASKNRNSEKLADLKGSLMKSEVNLQSLRGKLNIFSESIAEEKDLLIKTKNALEIISDEMLDILEKSQNNNNKLIFNGKTIKNIETRILDNKSASLKISAEAGELANALNEKTKLLSGTSEIIEAFNKELSDNRHRLSDSLNGLSECTARKAAIEKELMKTDMEILRLTDFIDNMEAFSEGTKNFLKSEKDYGARPLADIIEIEAGFENAVWECSGGMLDAVKISNMPDAEKAIDFINGGKIGEVKIFIPGKRKNRALKSENMPDYMVGDLRPVSLKNKISLNSEEINSEDIGINFYYHASQKDVFNYIEQTGFFPEINIITADGTLFISDGFIIAGKNKDLESRNLFINKKKLAEYENAGIEQRKTLNEEESAFKLKQEAIKELNTGINDISEAIKANEMKRLTLQNDIKHIENQLLKAKERLDTLKIEADNMENEKIEIYEEKENLEKEIIILDGESKLKADEKNKIEKRLQDFEAGFEKIKEEETALKIEANSAEQNISFIKKQIRDLESNILSYEKRIKSLIAAKEELAADITDAEKKLSDRKKDAVTLNESIRQVEAAIKYKESELGELKENIAAAEKDLENANRQKLNIDKKKDAVQAYININNEKLAELDSNRGLNGLPAEPDEEDKEFMAKIDSMGSSDVKKAIEEVNEKIKELGDINMNAAKEYGDAIERLGFLGKQKKDLENSIEALQGVIKKLDAVSKEKFNSSLTHIKQKFKELFTFLFGGGHADILNTAVLRNQDNPYENESQEDEDFSGMEINAQIPGKKFSGINLLSQGERVLVAVSLLFAIFLVKKTPFCVIDEVDAPLDYANNSRYNKLIEEIANYSQIILITHNKKTMEIGKNIFGVTSKHPGISGIVSVSMN